MEKRTRNRPLLWDENSPIAPQVVAVVGRVLLGEGWHGPLAHALKVEPRDVRRWTYKGAPAKITRRLWAISKPQRQEIMSALRALEDSVPGSNQQSEGVSVEGER